jgi:branched-chain amino acid aminotransferase
MTAKTPLLWVNGERQDFDTPSISAGDRGFTRGDGVFETLRVYRGKIFELDRHLSRLHQSGARVGIEVPENVRAACISAVREASREGLTELALRLTVTRGIGHGASLFAPSERLTIVIVLYELQRGPANIPEKGIRLHIVSAPKNERALTAGAKTLAYAESVAAQMEASAAGADEALFLDTRGFVSEGTTANVFFVSDGVLFTPSLGCGVLAGITRAVVLELAAELSISTCEGEFQKSRLLDAEEVFLTSSLREILPVSQVDHQTIGNGAPGPLTMRVVEAFEHRVLDE